jgi:DNA-binding transcriptional MerR regulator
MLDGIKTTFSISDLEELTGISAHSIRMWERRYGLLEPLRTDTNIRRYSNEHLKKLLNISLLLRSGYKISELADYSEEELVIRINSLLSKKADFEHEFNQWKLAMINFDTLLFEDTYHRLLKTMTFDDLFLGVILPFLERIGTLWQTNSITVAHEHFISSLIRQKLFFQIENLPLNRKESEVRYVLFLPLQELHELGLLFMHYSLLLHGHSSIYLGPNVDAATLQGIPEDKPRVFISYMTIAPAEAEVLRYLQDLRLRILKKNDVLYAIGARVRGFKAGKMWKNVTIFHLLKDLLKTI